MKSEARRIVEDETLTYQQMMYNLARDAENTDDYIKYSDEYYEAKKKGCLCDLNEGRLPFRPRYICPDYSVLMEKGSAFLEIDPPKDLMEACNALLIIYKHVPSVTSFPVFLGDLGDLLEPFVLKEDRAFAKKVLKMFLLHIDKTLTDSFVHANIGPKASVAGELILELTEEMQLAIPNLTLKYDPDITPDDFALKCIRTSLKTAKPSFANHKMFVSEWGEDYAIASCYNGLKRAGGGTTLPRMRLYECSLDAKSPEDFLDRVLPYYVNLQLEYMDKRTIYQNEEAAFFKSNFLVTEGFVKQDNFNGMFGMVGLAECCNHLLGITDKAKGFGNNKEAEELGVKIMDRMEELVAAHEAPYNVCTNHRYRLHAQVGIDTDGRENSPGTRIPVGVEPDILDQLAVNEVFQKYFPTGTGDIFRFEETYLNTPEAILDIIKGAFENNLRYFSGYLENNDVVRVTGYLVKKSELEKLRNKKQSLNQVSIFGLGAADCQDALDRRVATHEDIKSK